MSLDLKKLLGRRRVKKPTRLTDDQIKQCLIDAADVLEQNGGDPEQVKHMRNKMENNMAAYIVMVRNEMKINKRKKRK